MNKIKILFSVSILSLIVGEKIHADESNLAQLKKEVRLLTSKQNPDTGESVWQIQGKIIHQSWHGQGSSEPSFSPDGKAVHFGSVKENTKRRVIVAFTMKGDQLTYCGGDELPERVILTLLNSGKIPPSTHIDGCWVDPVKWLWGSKLLITSQMVCEGEKAYEISDFNCVWDLETGSCEYLTEYKSEKELVKSVDDPAGKSADLASKGQTKTTDENLENDPYFKSTNLRYYSASHGKQSMLTWGDVKVTQTGAFISGFTTQDASEGDRFFNDLEIEQLAASIEKFCEWFVIAKEEPPPSFTKEFPNITIPNFHPRFKWVRDDSDGKGGYASFQQGEYGYIRSASDVINARKNIKFIPTLRKLLRTQDQKAAQNKVETDNRFK